MSSETDKLIKKIEFDKLNMEEEARNYKDGNGIILKNCWRCAIKNSYHSGFDENLPQLEILKRYPYEMEFKINMEIKEFINLTMEDSLFEKILKKQSKPFKLQDYVVSLRAVSGNVEIIFRACNYCKKKIKNYEKVFENKLN